MKFILLIFLSFNYIIASTSVDEEKELCKAIIDNNIKKLVNQCSKYLEKYEVFDIVNKKFINLDDSPEKRDFFKKYVLEYRKISSYAEKTNKSIDKYIANYQSHDISYINNINIIFSNDNYTPSEKLMRKLINKDISDVNFSKNILDKLKLFKSMIAENEKLKRGREEQRLIRPHTQTRSLSRIKSQTLIDPLFKYIDFITMNAIYNKSNKILDIEFFYQNKAKDKLIFWKTGKVSATCKVYANNGDFLYPKKGSQIGEKLNKKLTRAFQDLYIDISSTKYKSAIAECILTINHKSFKAENTFSIH